MEKLIKNFFGEAETQKAQADLDQGISNFKSFATSLNNSQRRGLRTMAEGREGLARTISRVSLTHGDCLPRNEDPAELEQSLAYYDRLAGLL